MIARTLLAATLLLLTACTNPTAAPTVARPVSTSPGPTSPVSTSPPTTSEPAGSSAQPEPADPAPEQPQPPARQQPQPVDLSHECIPSELISEASGNPAPGPYLAGEPIGLFRCTYDGGTGGKPSRIEFTTESDEETFAARRDAFVSAPGNGTPFRERPDFFDEGYDTVEDCCESRWKSVTAARQGSIEVWVSWTLPVADEYRATFLETLFTKIFERLS
ncbi:hypothetical protein LFM09_27165 [Lentzea alba]|uniref:hypothetical protein n=1 Tax=Lentzea alba TaxID=2714351 RepID=UPI0039BEEAEE